MIDVAAAFENFLLKNGIDPQRVKLLVTTADEETAFRIEYGIKTHPRADLSKLPPFLVGIDFEMSGVTCRIAPVEGAKRVRKYVRSLPDPCANGSESEGMEKPADKPAGARAGMKPLPSRLADGRSSASSSSEIDGQAAGGARD